MLKAREAGFRALRGIGWSLTLPLAVGMGVIVGLSQTDSKGGIVAGAVVSLFGLLVLSLGYALGDIWSGYWTIPVALAGVDVALICYMNSWSWVTVLVATGVITLVSASVSAFNYTAKGNAGLLRVCTNFFRALIPG